MQRNNNLKQEYKEKQQQRQEQQLKAIENKIDLMDENQLNIELKNKGQATYGSRQERIKRLKKQYNITQDKDASPKKPKSSVVEEIDRMKQKRDERRIKQEEYKIALAHQQAQNEANGKLNTDVLFENMIQEQKETIDSCQDHISSQDLRLSVCVRKRPLFVKEAQNGEIDCISTSNPKMIIHQCNFKVDGITRFVENHEFLFDNTFSESEDNNQVYYHTVQNLIPSVLLQNLEINIFAYGQTGSGKTHTMQGIQNQLIKDIYVHNANQYKIYLSIYEIYIGKCYDLLNQRQQLTVLEDKNNNVQIQNLTEHLANNQEELFMLIEQGNIARTTKSTSSNDTSSRSHAIYQICIKNSENKIQGRILMVDLAGSERAQDCQSNNKERRIEGAEINKSLLALKECIRSMDSNASHVPFRGSKLTLVLRDSFISKKSSKTIMIACVSPGNSSSEHTINTLRYADRLKERPNVQITRREMKPQQNNFFKNQSEVPKQEIQPERKDIKQNIEVKLEYNKKDFEPQKEDNLQEKQKKNSVHEKQQEVISIHLAAIKEDAAMLQQESMLLTKLQEIKQILQLRNEKEIDSYIQKLKLVVQRKVKIYQLLDKKIQSFEKNKTDNNKIKEFFNK